MSKTIQQDAAQAALVSARRDARTAFAGLSAVAAATAGPLTDRGRTALADLSRLTARWAKGSTVPTARHAIVACATVANRLQQALQTVRDAEVSKSSTLHHVEFTTGSELVDLLGGDKIASAKTEAGKVARDPAMLVEAEALLFALRGARAAVLARWPDIEACIPTKREPAARIAAPRVDLALKLAERLGLSLEAIKAAMAA